MEQSVRVKQNMLISTYAKHMICSLIEKENCNNLKEKGINDFNSYSYRHNSFFYNGKSNKGLFLDKLCDSLGILLEKNIAPFK